MLTISLPLPWTLESAWILFQVGVQLSFVAVIVFFVIMIVSAMFVNMMS